MNYPRALLAAYAVTVAVALLVAGTTSGAAFGTYNPAWDGASDLREEATAAGADPVIVRNTTTYGTVDPDGSVAVVLSPDEGYDPEEADRVRSFVEAGGTLVVAEDYGPHGNDLLSAVGADARVDGRPVRDERTNYRSPALPVATNVTNASRVGGAEQLTLNHGTAVRPNGAAVLVATSEFAYLDADGDGTLDDDEALRSYPVATVEALGDGRVVVVGDPSLFINAMLDRPGNAAFVRGLFEDERSVLLDYSHAAGLPPLAAARLSLQRGPLLQVLAGLLGVLAIGAWGRGVDRETIRVYLGRDGEPERGEDDTVPEAALVQYLASEHPDWPRERIERVVERRRADRGDRPEKPP